MKLHVLQPGLVDLHSHFFNETLAWREAARELGLEWHCYGHQALAAGHAAQTGAVPAFRYAPDFVLEANPAFRPLADFLDFADCFAVDCRRALGGGTRADDLVLIPYATEREVFGAAMWLRELDEAHRPRVAFIVHRPDLGWSMPADRSTLSGDPNFWRYAGRRLAAVCPAGTVFIGARDKRLAAILRGTFPLAVQYVPMSTFTPGLTAAADGVARQYDLGMLGEFRGERGSAFVARLLAEVAVLVPDARFLLQVTEQTDRAAILDCFADAERVTLAVGNVTAAEFYRNVAACRLMILPYVPQRYQMRSSGVMSVATGLGVPVIVPGGTWLSDRIDEGSASGLVYETLTAEFVAAALHTGRDEDSAIRQQAAALAGPWRERHSTRTVLDMIFAGLGHPGAAAAP